MSLCGFWFSSGSVLASAGSVLAARRTRCYTVSYTFVFGGFSLVFKGFFDSERSQDDSMLDLVLGGVLEASWTEVGRVLSGQDAPKMAQDGAKTAQDGAKIAHDGAKTAQDGAKIAQNDAKMGQYGAKTGQDGTKTCQDGAKIAQDGAKTCQDGARTCQDGAKTGHDRAKMGNMAERAQRAMRAEHCRCS